ncbi:LacI family DNA-binding transcriptional regulator [Paenarthrobacter sp. YJN-5]|uniref:LacI family DNA-binding transcriptional regulator n=1 Tax=Paenarthrobacter sp. YJN-5 TaxID=2735316 RepID=UPI001878032A|nr:LacI family DNA-binding transcriptional regulator [Paenarthrobacter sp. YJN-5]QOT15382.1 LacI family DNA-binding transcriptional regulator [Paenarthrobacter sp. YJN-5]
MASPNPNGRRPTIVDIAKQVGVSPAAVSMVLRDLPGIGEETRQKVLAVAAELNYRPDSRARLLRSRRSKMLGVLYSLMSPFHADVVQWLYESAAGRGYTVMLGALAENISASRAAETLLSARCDGIILIDPESTMDEEAISVVSQVPTVAIGHMQAREGTDLVQASGAEGIAQAMGHLVSLGHRRIVHVSGGASLAGLERSVAYMNSMERLGLAEEARVIEGDGSDLAGVLAARTLLESELPTAVLTYNDTTAVGLLFELLRAGVSVPADVSVVGYDDSHVASLPHIGLTSIAQGSRRLAAAAVERMDHRLNDIGSPITPTFPSIDVLTPHLVVRSSTGLPREMPD